MHETGLSFYNHVIPCGLCIRACLTVTSDTGIDETWVDFLAVLPTETHGSKLAGDVVFDEDISLGDKFVEDGKAIRILEVDRDRTFIAVRLQEVGGFWRTVWVGGALDLRS